jgi:hypothetical protein
MSKMKMIVHHGYQQAPNPHLTTLQRESSPKSAHITGFLSPSCHIQEMTDDNPQRSHQAISLDLSDLVPQALLCHPCTSKRYNFTAYFHNSNIFKLPPHEFLHFVERAYILENRLKTLLVSYAIHSAFERSWQEVVLEIDIWSALVDELMVDVAMTTSDEQLSVVLGSVQMWSAEMIRQLKRHVCGVEQLVMPRGRLRELGSDFRKVWEKVWATGALHYI